MPSKKFDTIGGGLLDSDWREAFQQMQAATVVAKETFAKVAGKEHVLIPASSVATVTAKGLKTVTADGPSLFLEPVSTSLPSGLVVLPTLVTTDHHVFPVHIINMSQEDLWLLPRTRLDVLANVDHVNTVESYEVKFQRISVDVEQISIDV